MDSGDARTLRRRRRELVASAPELDPAIGPVVPAELPGFSLSGQDVQSAEADSTTVHGELERGRVLLYGQPILDLEANEVRHFELLLEIPGRNARLLTPADSVREDKQARGSPAFEIWAICEAIFTIARYERADESLSLQVKVSGASISAAAAALVEDALSRARINPASLILEAGATERPGGPQQALSFAQRLRQRGCRFVLGDFPSLGSFCNVGTLPVDYLKIDDDFVRGIATNTADQLLVRTIVDIARELGKPTIAGLVDDAATADCLQQCGVDYVMGMCAGPPRPFAPPRSESLGSRS